MFSREATTQEKDAIEMDHHGSLEDGLYWVQFESVPGHQFGIPVRNGRFAISGPRPLPIDLFSCVSKSDLITGVMFGTKETSNE